MTIAIIIVFVALVVTVGFLVGRFLWVPSRNKKCSRCGERTPLESEVCEHCGHVFHVR
jgi:predicted amidophosphoribosyltransferase